MEKLGIKETLNKDFMKLTFKYQVINQKERKNFRIIDSVHTLGVQRSNYLQVDNMLMSSLHHHPNKVKAMAARI